jgi:hypothetical protein
LDGHSCGVDDAAMYACDDDDDDDADEQIKAGGGRIPACLPDIAGNPQTNTTTR